MTSIIDNDRHPALVGEPRKSSFSAASDCVMLSETTDPDIVAMWNSNDAARTLLYLQRSELRALLADTKAGRLDGLV